MRDWQLRVSSRRVKRSPTTPWATRILRGKKGAEVGEIWVEASLGLHWIAAYRFVDQSGEPVVAEVRVFPKEPGKGRPGGMWSAEYLGVNAPAPPGGIPADLLRQVRVTGYRGMAERGFHQLGRLLSLGPPPILDEPRPMASARGRPDEFYAQIAREYVDLLTANNPHPINELSRSRSIPKSKVRDMIRQARKRGLLTPTSRGKLRGQLTPQALELLGRSAAGKTRSRQS